MKYLIYTFFVILVFATVGAAQSRAGITIGMLDNSGHRYIDGCGCPQIWAPGRGQYGSEGDFYMLPTNGGDGAYMKLDGRVVELKKSGTNRPKNTRKGTKFYELYKGAGYSVRVNHTVTKSNEYIEDFAITITVTKGRLSKTVNAAGQCGC